MPISSNMYASANFNWFVYALSLSLHADIRLQKQQNMF